MRKTARDYTHNCCGSEEERGGRDIRVLVVVDDKEDSARLDSRLLWERGGRELTVLVVVEDSTRLNSRLLWE